MRVEGVVVGDFQAAGGLTGYFLQDAGDGDPATSDGIFVYAPGTAVEVSVGDIVNVAGSVSEFASAAARSPRSPPATSRSARRRGVADAGPVTLPAMRRPASRSRACP